MLSPATQQLQFRDHLERLGMTQGDVARWLEVTDRTVRRWASPGSGFPPPKAVMMLLALMEWRKLGPSEVEQIAWRDHERAGGDRA